jgi:outer membrane protein TolC
VLFAISQVSNAQTKNDLNWLINQIRKHPEIIAAKEALSGDLYQADSLDKALYNPEISSDFGKEGSDRTYTLGINQTIDFNNKRDSRRQQAVFARVSAQKDYELLMQNKMAQALNALVSWESSLKRSKLVSQQEKQLEDLLEIVNKRTSSGDLGQLDAELTYLSLSQRFGETARVQAQLRRAEANLKQLLPDWNNCSVAIPKKNWDNQIEQGYDDLLEKHPIVQMAKAQWEVALLTAEVAKKNKKADPTVGLEAGKLGSEDVLSLTFSMPLYVRNNFSLQYKAANQQAIAAESNYHAAKRKQQFSIKASQLALKEYRNRYQKWQNLMQGRGENSESLLQKQWNVGDISTTEYLLTLQQRTEGLLAGIELEQEYQSAVIQLLLDTAQLYSPTTETK